MQVLKIKTSKIKYITILIYFILLVLISHIILPYWNNGKDFLLFTRWDLFAMAPRQNVFDIRCQINGRDIYFLRTEGRYLKQNNFKYRDIENYFYNPNSSQTNSFKNNLMEKCDNKLVWIVKLKGSLYSHIFSRYPEVVLGQVNL